MSFPSSSSFSCSRSYEHDDDDDENEWKLLERNDLVTKRTTHHALRITQLVLLLAGLVAFAAPAGANIVSVDAEISVGREAAQYVEQVFPMSTDPLLIARVQRIGRRLAGACDRPELPFEFHVVDTPDINAFCLPGGFVYVFRGLLQGVPDDDALAFVMAHEITHAVRRHSLNQFEKSQALRIVTSPLGSVVGVFARDLANALLNLHFSRQDEAEADHYGLLLAVRAGFAPDSGVKGMDMLLTLAGKDHYPEFLSDHPATTHRRATLLAMAEELKKHPVLHLASAPVTLPELAWDAPAQPVHPSPLFPLTMGSTWTYRLAAGSSTDAEFSVKVVEERPGDVRGIYRLESTYDGGLTTDAWVAPTTDAILTRPAGKGAAPWRTDWRLAGGDGFALVGTETVNVPAGEFQATHVRRSDADGRTVADAWFASGVGLVKCVWASPCVTQELTGYTAGS